MRDLTDNPVSIALIEPAYNAGKPVAALCHAPTLLRRLTYQGRPMVRCKLVRRLHRRARERQTPDEAAQDAELNIEGASNRVPA